MDLYIVNCEGHVVEEPGLCLKHTLAAERDFRADFPDLITGIEGRGIGECAWAEFGGCGTDE